MTGGTQGEKSPQKPSQRLIFIVRLFVRAICWQNSGGGGGSGVGKVLALRRESDDEMPPVGLPSPSSGAVAAEAEGGTGGPGGGGTAAGLSSMKCWVCNGTGVTSSGWMDADFESEAKSKGQLTPDGSVECCICFSEVGKYGVSVECHHLFCRDCIPHILQGDSSCVKPLC